MESVIKTVLALAVGVGPIGEFSFRIRIILLALLAVAKTLKNGHEGP